nr:SDR family oxidoreductase [Alicyclobacillus sp. ALC3]
MESRYVETLDNPHYRPAGKLEHKIALITGGDSVIGQAVALAFAKEGADIALSYVDAREEVDEVRHLIETYGRRCLLIPGDIGYETPHTQAVIDATIDRFGEINILVNNARAPQGKTNLLDIASDERAKMFRTLVFSQFIITQKALPHITAGGAIINTMSVTAYTGSADSISLSSASGAIVAFTRSLSLSLAAQGIRVNGVAPGVIGHQITEDSGFPTHSLLVTPPGVTQNRVGYPYEVAPAYVFLASDDASYISGQVIHVNGGTIVNE